MTAAKHNAKPFRVIVTGSRYTAFEDRNVVFRELNTVVREHPGRSVIVVHGACPQGGVDADAAAWTLTTPDARVEGYPAEAFGSWPACGPKRNSHMVSLGADLCLGFPRPQSKGTWDCLRKACDAGIPIRVRSLHGAWRRVP